ncbi:hydantoinase B/oxoprolinase family protein [Bradyrhizobium canariense]|uniref:N-methylhydantoinase B n=1 Tax=Bradyrhizobium canariense TaxID=255045 RepID=A0A1H1NBV0_9BRAD|nr:hydantoinase B/oxoprolinase family protein [Bradyrhizobium canariense]SDR96402.1 N-methylhydantoinase B [Bradyrhizobium canariense]
MNKQAKLRTDPITFEVIDFLLRAIASELETNLTRTSYSLMIYEYKDFAVGIVAADGQLICQGTGGLPIFLADIGAPLKSVLEAHPIETIRPGDAFVTNDPEASGQHLNNVTMYTPVFGENGEDLIAFITVRAHWTDIGGAVFGSMMTSSSTEIFQEGIQFPALKFCDAGHDDSQILRLIAKNSRIPEITIGDLQAQLAACRLGEQRLKEMMARYGWDTIRATIDERWVRSEMLARKRIEKVPDGTYEASCWLDNDGIELDRRLPFNFKVHIRGDEVTIDFTDIVNQVKGPYNAGMIGGGITAAKVAYKYALIPDLHSDEGCFRPLKVILPPGKILSAGENAPMARFNVIMATVIDGLIKAFGEAVPDNVAAAHHAAQNSIQFTGRRANGKLWNYNDTAHGGWGASLRADGSGPFKTMSHGDCKDIPVEIVEALYPIRIEEVSLRQDSGGAGKHRGGLGTVRRCTVLDDANLTTAWERTTCAPWGLFGGKPAEVGSVTVVLPDRSSTSITKVTQVPIKQGTQVTFLTAGGGGCGDPLERPIEDVVRDVELGYVSGERAQRDYGVVLTGAGRLDEQATAERRGARP